MEKIKYFGRFDEEGFPESFYNTDVWEESDIPAESVEITEAQWREFVSNGGVRRWDGSKPVVYEGVFMEDSQV